MDWGPADNTCVNTVCLFPEPSALGVGSVFLSELSLMVASHIAPGEEEEESPWMLKEKSVLAKGKQDAACPWNICGPVPRLTRWGWDLFVSRSLSRLAHHRETSPKSYRWEKVEGKFLKRQSWKGFFFYDMGYGISVWKSPFSYRLDYKILFLTSSKQPRTDTRSSDLPQQKTGSGCRINKKKKYISLSSGELSCSQHITRYCVMTELKNITNMSAALILPRRKTQVRNDLRDFKKKEV